MFTLRILWGNPEIPAEPNPIYIVRDKGGGMGGRGGDQCNVKSKEAMYIRNPHLGKCQQQSRYPEIRTW